MANLNPYEIRGDFPTLKRKIRGKPLIYFDNAASSLKPIQVIQSITEFYRDHYSNIHRGVHTLSQEATSLYEEARETVSNFIGAGDSREVIFTSGTTDSINLVAYGYGFTHLGEGDEILLTIMEHHSNLLPWRNIASIRNAKIKYLDITDEGTLKYEELEEKLTERTKIVAVTQMSNVTGVINDLTRIAKAAHKLGALVLVDGAQSVPHMRVDVKEIGADFLVFSGHKMLGPTGIGVLWVRGEILDELQPYRFGGGTVREVGLREVEYDSPPILFEAGTPNIAGAVGLKTAVEYLEKIGMENIEKYLGGLLQV